MAHGEVRAVELRVTPLSRQLGAVVEGIDFAQPVEAINAKLRERGIFGGGAITSSSALYCVTEVHAQEDIDRLVDALAEVTK